jgi:hypothetical protein
MARRDVEERLLGITGAGGAGATRRRRDRRSGRRHLRATRRRARLPCRANRRRSGRRRDARAVGDYAVGVPSSNLTPTLAAATERAAARIHAELGVAPAETRATLASTAALAGAALGGALGAVPGAVARRIGVSSVVRAPPQVPSVERGLWAPVPTATTVGGESYEIAFVVAGGRSEGYLWFSASLPDPLVVSAASAGGRLLGMHAHMLCGRAVGGKWPVALHGCRTAGVGGVARSALDMLSGVACARSRPREVPSARARGRHRRRP